METDSLTNEIIEKEETIVKKYTMYPTTAVFKFIISLLMLDFRFPTGKYRLKNEIEFNDELDNTEIKSPEIVDNGECYIEMDKIDGENLYNYLNECSKEKAIELGLRVSQMLEELHGNNLSNFDFRLTNIIKKDDELYLIDYEYSEIGTNRFYNWVDYFTLYSSSRQTRNYKQFNKRFVRDDYKIILLSIFSSIFHALFLEKDLYRFKRALFSVVLDFQYLINRK